MGRSMLERIGGVIGRMAIVTRRIHVDIRFSRLLIPVSYFLFFVGIYKQLGMNINKYLL